jgi:hypothetical protein
MAVFDLEQWSGVSPVSPETPQDMEEPTDLTEPTRAP